MSSGQQHVPADAFSAADHLPSDSLLEQMPSLQSPVGEVVSHVWFSDYSICYIELGALTAGRRRRDGSAGNPVGELTLFFGYDWTFEDIGQSISRLDFHAGDVDRDALAAALQGSIVQSIQMISDSLEIEIRFSTGGVLRTVSGEGEAPDWDIRFNKRIQGYLCIENQELQFVRCSP